VKQKRWRSSSSSAWYQKQLEGRSGTPGTGGCPGGYLQGRRRRRARNREGERRRDCLGGREEWCESEGARRGPFIGRRGRARGWPEVGAGAVSVEAAVAGRVGGAWAAFAGVGVMSVARWSRRVTTDETGSSGICGSSEGNSGRCRLAVSRPAGLRGQRGMVEGRGDAMRLARARAGREGDSGRCRSAVATSGSDAHQVFDEMPARSKNSNF
jgi:hypothetical protein